MDVREPLPKLRAICPLIPERGVRVTQVQRAARAGQGDRDDPAAA